MPMRSSALVFLIAAFAQGGCVIGTWPTPEEKGDAASKAGRGDAPLGEEACDGVDNDGDGSIDEGCPCAGEARGCTGVDGGMCGLGVQWCVHNQWRECSDIGPPFVQPKEPKVTLTQVLPASLTRDGPGLTVSVAVEASCPNVAAEQVVVRLVAETPMMRVTAVAHDDGQGDDAAAGDGLFTVGLPNPFGPGVPAQQLSLSATATLDEKPVEAKSGIALEVP